MVYRKAHILLIGCLWFINSPVHAQDQKVADSLALIYQQNTVTDTAKLVLLRDLSFNETRDLNKGLQYAEELIGLSEKSNDNKFLRVGYFLKGTKKRLLGKLDEALEAYVKSAEIAGKTNNLKAEGEAYGAIADIYAVANNYPNALHYYQKAIIILQQYKGDSTSLASVLSNAGDAYLNIKNYDSALIYFNDAKQIFDKVHYLTGQGYSLGNIGMVYANIGKNDLAEKNINEAMRILENTQDYYPICVYLVSMADIYLKKGENQAALNYTLRSLQLAEKYGLKEQIADASLKLSDLYEKTGKITASFKYYKKHIAYRDSLNNINTVQRLADVRTNYEVSQKQIEVDLLNQQKRNEKKLSVSLGIILGLTIIILAILLKNNQNRQKAYKILDLQKQETDAQRIKAENALSDLQVTQNQLIQSAKMASLGELTAGIAHEIQNPLNFVNNFSEVSVELLEELMAGTMNNLTASDKAEAGQIIKDLAENLKKISNHGKRADSVVKGMLQHSMPSTGKKEPTELNVLADDYLRLGYLGIRNKDKEFNTKFISVFDENMGKVEVVPQDIGRVLLNLYNNAFYAIKEKKKQGDPAFEPLVSVTTKRTGNTVQISVKDNGTGIPQKLLDKIFQPFFTTKPPGQGTGLGLSLSYDIIKTHGGQIKVETEEGEFTEFIIQLPANIES